MSPLVLTAALQALGYCSDSPLEFFPPPGTTVPDRPEVTISFGSGRDADGTRMVTLMDDGPVLANDTGHRVALVEVELHATSEENQMVLRPAHPLAEGEWHLDFERRSSPAWASRATWRSTGRTDSTPPTWAAPPAVTSAWVAGSICGEMASLEISVPLVGEPSAQALVEFWHVSGKDPIERMRLTIRDGRVNLATGSCTGRFALIKGDHLVRVTAVDLAGNETPSPGGPIPVTLDRPERH